MYIRLAVFTSACWDMCVRLAVFISACWDMCVRLAVFSRSACWDMCVRLAVFRSACWDMCVRLAVFTSACWDMCVRLAVFRSANWVGLIDSFVVYEPRMRFVFKTLFLFMFLCGCCLYQCFNSTIPFKMVEGVRARKIIKIVWD